MPPKRNNCIPEFHGNVAKRYKTFFSLGPAPIRAENGWLTRLADVD